MWYNTWLYCEVLDSLKNKWVSAVILNTIESTGQLSETKTTMSKLAVSLNSVFLVAEIHKEACENIKGPRNSYRSRFSTIFGQILPHAVLKFTSQNYTIHTTLIKWELLGYIISVERVIFLSQKGKLGDRRRRLRSNDFVFVG